MCLRAFLLSHLFKFSFPLSLMSIQFELCNRRNRCLFLLNLLPSFSEWFTRSHSQNQYSKWATTHENEKKKLVAIQTLWVKWKDALDLWLIVQSIWTLLFRMWQTHAATSAAVAVVAGRGSIFDSHIHHSRAFNALSIATDTIDETICRVYENGSGVCSVCVCIRLCITLYIQNYCKHHPKI